MTDSRRSVGCWVTTLRGIGYVVDVRAQYFEEWQAIPNGRSIGDSWVTLITVKLAFDFDGNPLKRLSWETCNIRLCDGLNAKMQKKINGHLASDPKFAAKVDTYRIENWANIFNLHCDATESEWRAVQRALEENADAIEAGLSFQQVRALLERAGGYTLRLSATPTGRTLQLSVRLDSPQEPPRVFRGARALG